MSAKLTVTVVTTDEESFSWHQIWLRAITRPSSSTFKELLALEGATRNRALKWMALVGILRSSLLALAIVTTIVVLDVSLGLSAIPLFVALAAVGPLLLVLFLAITAVATHFTARVLGGQGEFDELIFALGAFFAPIAAANSFLMMIPLLNLLILPLLLYDLVLRGIAVKTVYAFSWLRTGIAVAVPIGLSFLAFVALALAAALF